MIGGNFMVLAHELFGSGNEGVIVMHDFYGCKDTWSFTRNFSILGILLSRLLKLEAMVNQGTFQENIPQQKHLLTF